MFQEKAPVVSNEDLRAEGRWYYPRVGILACTVVGTPSARDGQEVVTVSTELPWGIESVSGDTQFDVFRNQLVALEQEASEHGVASGDRPRAAARG